MENETYNGWTNWETWNVNLWIFNHEPNYRMFEAFAAGCGSHAITANDAYDFFADFMNECTPDMSAEQSHGVVNWEEIAESMREYQEIA